MIFETLLIISLAVLGAAYYMSMYAIKKKNPKDWEIDRDIFFSLLGQDILLLLAVFIPILCGKILYLDGIILATQLGLFLTTEAQSDVYKRLWPLPLAILIVVLHFAAFIYSVGLMP
jgi:uncharacterized BrkB/YihY/UPF0761 family membrane protein